MPDPDLSSLDECIAAYRPGVYPVLDLHAIGATGPSTKHPALRIDEVVLKWLRAHFGVVTNIVDQNLAGKVWRNEDGSPIIIDSLAEFSQEKANHRPAVLSAMSSQMPEGPARTIDHRRIGGCGAGQAVRAYAQLWVGSHVFHCCGGREGEAKILAFEVAEELNKFAPVVGKALCLVRFELSGVGDRRRLEEYQETWSLPVGLRYAYWRAWVLEQPDAVPLGQVNVTPSSP